MPSAKRHASRILTEYGEAQTELIGKAVVLTNGKAGTVENGADWHYAAPSQYIRSLHQGAANDARPPLPVTGLPGSRWYFSRAWRHSRRSPRLCGQRRRRG